LNCLRSVKSVKITTTHPTEVKVLWAETDAEELPAVYDFGMAKYIHVQMGGIEAPANIKADKAEDNRDGLLVLKLGDQTVAEFDKGSVLSWWISETATRN
jgi:hypothetical protein